MDKLQKVGLTALGTALVSTASFAGDMAVTGSAIMTFANNDNSNVGNAWSMSDTMTFTGSGELDNGWSVALSVAHANANAYSNTNVTVGIPGLGDIRIDQGTSGTGGDTTTTNGPGGGGGSESNTLTPPGPNNNIGGGRKSNCSVIEALNCVEALANIKVKKTYLMDALNALGSGKSIKVAETKALGCSIKFANK